MGLERRRRGEFNLFIMTTGAQQQSRGRKRPKSRFGAQLEEKQNLKEIYGVAEAQLKKYYTTAKKSNEETGPALIELLERRLDNAIYRAGFATTRAQARQMASHGLFNVNGRPVNVASIILREGDLVQVKETKRKKSYFSSFDKRMQSAQVAEWITLDVKNYGFKVAGKPSADQTGIGVAIQEVVEFLSR
jgi:small subunit ribosomal protein S4